MSNMSYCRFRNTEQDLEECADSLENQDSLHFDEAAAAHRMVEACHRYLEAYEQWGEKGEDDE